MRLLMKILMALIAVLQITFAKDAICLFLTTIRFSLHASYNVVRHLQYRHLTNVLQMRRIKHALVSHSITAFEPLRSCCESSKQFHGLLLIYYYNRRGAGGSNMPRSMRICSQVNATMLLTEQNQNNASKCSTHKCSHSTLLEFRMHHTQQTCGEDDSEITCSECNIASRPVHLRRFCFTGQKQGGREMRMSCWGG